jgi:hypothetical protein
MGTGSLWKETLGIGPKTNFGLPWPLRCESFVRKSGGSEAGQSERDEELVFFYDKFYDVAQAAMIHREI